MPHPSVRTLVLNGSMALLGSAIVFYTVIAAVFAVYMLSLYFFSFLDTGGLRDSELPVIWLVGVFCISLPFLYFGYCLALCWRFVAVAGAAAIFILSGLGILPKLLDWIEYNPLYQFIPGASLLIFSFYKRDALRFVEGKKPCRSSK